MKLLPVETALLGLREPPSGSSDLIRHACQADFEGWRSCSGVTSLFRFEKEDAQAKISVDWAKANALDETDRLACAAATLHAFVQANFTGPAIRSDTTALFTSNTGDVTRSGLNENAVELLATGGEPAYHLMAHGALLVVSLQLLGLMESPEAISKPVWTLESAKIWRLRAAFVWIRILDEPVPIDDAVLTDARQLHDALDYNDPNRARLSLLLAQIAFHMSRSFSQSSSQKEASNFAREAASESGLQWRLTGHLGKRTKFQVDQKMQLVVLAKDDGAATAADSSRVPQALPLNDDTVLEKTDFSRAVNDEAQEFGVDPSNQPELRPFSQAVLLALALATLPQVTSLVNLSADVLTTAQVSAFVARVLDQPQNWSVHSMALLLRSRAEAGRSRTVERGVLQMQALVDQLRDGTSQVSAISSAVKDEDIAPASERLSEFHSLLLPSVWEMERELALRYINLGVTKSALDIFIRLEMWDEVARCWNILNRPDKGIEIIKSLLKGERMEFDEQMLKRKEQEGSQSIWRGGEKREAKLWCILGELEQNPAHFDKAWEVSRHTSSRAKRSLGAMFFAKEDFEKASDALTTALRINPLFHRSWYILGCCEMRLERWAAAQDAFSRCVSLEDEDAQSWSNLASCHLRRGEIEGNDAENETDPDDEQATSATAVANLEGADEQDAKRRLPFSRKRAAFQCLRQAVKHAYEQWRVWYNYMIVAIDVGEMSEACRAQSRIVEIRADRAGVESLDMGVLERLVDAVTRVHETDQSAEEVPGHVDPNVGRGLEPRVRRLIEDVVIPKLPSIARVYSLQARLAFWRGDYAGALDANLRAYRSSSAMSDNVSIDSKTFSEGCDAVRAAVDALENFGGRQDADGNLVAKDWKFQARSLVRSFLGKTKESFEDEEKYQSLKELLSELK